MQPIPSFIICRSCKYVCALILEREDIIKLRNGGLIQEVLPHFPPDIREMLLNGICPSCQKK